MASPDVIFLAGCGRSGTTWLAEMLNYDESYRLIFEPLRHDIGADVARRLGYWRYLRPEADLPDIVAGMQAVLEGRESNEWADQFSDPSRSRRLVKEIRAHFLLGWLRRQFPSLPMVLILRHPCAVAASEIRMGWTGWQEPIDAMLAQEDLLRDHLHPYVDLMRSADSTFERRIMLWCVRTLVPFRQLAPDDVHVVLYEHLLADPMRELAPLFSALDRPLDEPEVMNVWRRPSALKVAHSGATSNDDPLTGWRAATSAADLDAAMRVLDAFGFGALYGPDPMPDRAALPRLFGGLRHGTGSDRKS